jgi:hypothetical protein
LVSDIPAGDGKNYNLFYSVATHRKTEKERNLSDRKRREVVGEEITHTTERKHGSL